MAKQKTWLLNSIGVSGPSIRNNALPDISTGDYRERVNEFLETQVGVTPFIGQEISALALRRPYDHIWVRLDRGGIPEPYIQQDLDGCSLVVPILQDINEVLTTSANDFARSEFFAKMIEKGMKRLDDIALLDAFDRGMLQARAAGFRFRDTKPDRTRVQGAEILMETRYEESAFSRICHVKLWIPGRPSNYYEKRFEVGKGPKKSWATYTPVQGAILMGNTIRMAQTSWEGWIPNDELLEHDIPLALLKKRLGHVKLNAKTAVLHAV